MKIKKLFLVSLIYIFSIINIFPCTTVIISGKITVDGRPLLWKHRDSNSFQNKIMFFTDGKFKYIGLVNSEDINGNEIWIGCNEKGFAIMNSASYNLKDKNDKTEIADREGIVMKLALQQCETIDDFEKLLQSMEKPLGVEANFGVIDAKGGAAYFETNNFTYKKYDVNDPEVAPLGYLIRSNFSFSGREDEGYGYIRYATAQELFLYADEINDLSYKFIIQNITRSLKHSLTKMDLQSYVNELDTEPRYFTFEDFIPRYISTSSVVVQGVNENEDPKLTTMWTVLGFPLSSVAIPIFAGCEGNIPTCLVSDKTGNAKLCDLSLKFKDLIFPIKRGSGTKYANLTALINKNNTGIMQKIVPIENKIIEEGEKYLVSWRASNSINFSELIKFNGWVDKLISNEYKLLFEID